MTSAGHPAEGLAAIEALMLEKFRAEPFHNLRLLFGEAVGATVPGGTCSEKTLSFLAAARAAGFEVALHSAFIGGQEKHRLARVHLHGRVYFADVGDGWPAVKLYPADREVAYHAFGVGFRTQVSGTRLKVFCERQGREDLQLEIEVRPRPERDILHEIERRFTSGLTYPFSASLRYACVVGDRFLFLRGDQLEIYEDGRFDIVRGLDDGDLPRVLRGYFGHQLGVDLPLREEVRDGR